MLMLKGNATRQLFINGFAGCPASNAASGLSMTNTISVRTLHQTACNEDIIIADTKLSSYSDSFYSTSCCKWRSAMHREAIVA